MKNENTDVLIYESVKLLCESRQYIIGFLQPSIQPSLLAAEKFAGRAIS